MKIKRKNKKKKYPTLYLLIVLLISLALILIIYFYNLFKTQEYDLDKIPLLSLDGFVEVENVRVAAQNIFLYTGCYSLSMTTELEQIRSIAVALDNITMPRPDAHDLFARSLKNFEISLLFVKIHSLVDGTYHARILLKKENNILALDSKPSDAIAIALRTNSPIYLNKELLSYAQKGC